MLHLKNWHIFLFCRGGNFQAIKLMKLLWIVDKINSN